MVGIPLRYLGWKKGNCNSVHKFISYIGKISYIPKEGQSFSLVLLVSMKWGKMNVQNKLLLKITSGCGCDHSAFFRLCEYVIISHMIMIYEISGMNLGATLFDFCIIFWGLRNKTVQSYVFHNLKNKVEEDICRNWLRTWELRLFTHKLGAK